MVPDFSLLYGMISSKIFHGEQQGKQIAAPLCQAILSVQITEGKAAFSTLNPDTILPDTSLSAAPALNLEYGE